jgi:hypothetical protein
VGQQLKDGKDPPSMCAAPSNKLELHPIGRQKQNQKEEAFYLMLTVAVCFLAAMI